MEKVPRFVMHVVVSASNGQQLLTMSEVRGMLPWPQSDVSTADHATLALLVQRLAGWKHQWRTRPGDSKTSPFQYHVDALAWFARAAEVVALIRYNPSITEGMTGEVKRRLAAFSEELRPKKTV